MERVKTGIMFAGFIGLCLQTYVLRRGLSEIVVDFRKERAERNQKFNEQCTESRRELDKQLARQKEIDKDFFQASKELQQALHLLDVTAKKILTK
jgi:F0F1-type ATP synthase epsilon subunit